MSKTINIGTRVDVMKLVESRLLVQGSSGSGKSYALRVLAEGVMPVMPVILLDWEGEFATLREKFDTLIVGQGGDVTADVKSAALLARSVIELGVSAVVDLADLKMAQRSEYVRQFLGALVSMPKKLWPSKQGKAVMVMVDEAHKLCPQKEKSVATGAVTDLCSLGRKRGLCAVLATQRLSKLNKDAAAECSNIMIGRCSTIDAARAADELGLPASARHELTQMKTGHWKAVGPAFADGLQEFIGARAMTTHAKFGAKLLVPPAPSSAIRMVLPKIDAANARQAQEVDDLAAAKKEIKRLERELKAAQRDAPPPAPELLEKAAADAARSRDRQWQKETEALLKASRAIRDVVRAIADSATEAIRDMPLEQLIAEFGQGAPAVPPVSQASPAKRPREPKAPSAYLLNDPLVHDLTARQELDQAQQRIVDSLAWWSVIGVQQPPKRCVAVMAGYTENGHFRNKLGSLRTAGLVDYPAGKLVTLTEAGKQVCDYPNAAGTMAELHDAWRDRLDEAQRKIFDALIEAWPDAMDPEDLAAAAGYTNNGHFRNKLGSLRTLGVASKGKPIHATDLVFPDALK